MSRPTPTDSTGDHRLPNSDPGESARFDREPRTGGEPRTRTALWRTPTTIIALFGLLFGPNLVGRFACAVPSDEDGQVQLRHLLADEKGRFHARYSFKKAPFVHPEIIGDLVRSLADTGDQVVAVNLLDSQDRNRYFGEIFVQPQADPMVPSWPWVYTLKDGPYAVTAPDISWGQQLYAYRYVGSTPSGLDVLHHRNSGGGSGVFNYIVFVRIAADYGVGYRAPRASIGGQRAARPEFHQREVIRFVGQISLGDRWLGTVEISGNDVVARGRDVYERCDTGDVNIMEALEMRRFLDMDCDDGEAGGPPPAQVYRAPERY